MLKLIIEDDEGRKTVVPFVRDEITIGRQEGNTIRLTERNVSRRHARLLRQHANVLIEDLGSYNGIKVNGDRITGQVQVQDGDLIQIGDYDLAIQREEEARQANGASDATRPLPVGSSAPTMKLPDPGATLPALPAISVPEASEDDVHEAPALSEETPKHQSTAVIRIDQLEATRPQRSVHELDPAEAPRLVVMNTDFAGREFACVRTELRIGRTDDNDIALDHRSLSRTHCKLVREDSGEWKVIDLQSANGLMVNGEPYAQVTLRPGDVLELGHLKLKFVGPGEPSTITSSSSNVTEHTQTGSSGSRGPLIAVAVAILVLVVGGGGYALFKSTTTDPKPKPPVTNNDDPDQQNPQPPDPAVDEAEQDRLIADAETALARLDIGEAESLLKQCKIGESPCPKAEKLLMQLANEKPFVKTLDEAATALEAGDVDNAGRLLQTVGSTKLFGKRYRELDQARQVAVQALIAAKKDPPPVKPPNPPGPGPGPGPAPVDNAKKDQIAKLLEEAKEHKKAKRFAAAIKSLERCLDLEKTSADCTVSLASVYAQKGADDNNATDVDRARELYTQFLKIAPADDKRRERVKKILSPE